MIDKEPYGHGALKWVSTSWLEDHMDEVKIVDVQPDVHDYFKAHIPEAVYLSGKTFRAPLNGLPAQYVTPQHIEGLLGRIGLAKDTPVVVYTGKGKHKGWGDGLDQPMMAYTLLRHGAKEVYLLDGGIDKWIEEGREISQEFPDVTPDVFDAEVDEDMFMTLEEVEEKKDMDDVILLDARPSKFYTGEESPWIRDGHIPGAVNLPWAILMTDDNKTELKAIEEIESLAEEVGATKDKLIICSCGTGREATAEYTIFKHLLGYPKVKLFEGSFTEWSTDPEREVVTGKDPY